MTEEPTNQPPNEVKRILCLANSRKLSGRCVAGREILDGHPGPWIRPVGNREHQEVTEVERAYQDGSDPKVLDVIDVPLIRACPHEFQQENWLLDPDFYWVKAGTMDRPALASFIEPVEALWTNGQDSYKGLNDRVAIDHARTLRSSLRLIRVGRLDLIVSAPGAHFGNPKRRIQGRFTYRDQHYWLWVTDPLCERQYLAMPDGAHGLGDCCLTISLGEPHEGFVYKLIAAIIEMT